MQQALGLQALSWLGQLELRVKRSGSAVIQPDRKTAAKVIGWCIEQQLLPAHSTTQPWVRIDQSLLDQIATAQRQLGQACFRDNPRQKSRLEAAKDSQQELKSAGPSPRQQRVLLWLNEPLPLAGFSTQVLDTDWQQLPLPEYDALLVVENLDCFYQLERFELSLPYQHPLIVYRGDAHYSSGCKALKAACLEHRKPCIYFGDFDAKGVSIALHEGYCAMLLPYFTELRHRASAMMLPDEQLNYLIGIQRRQPSPDFNPYQQLLCEQLKGLRQQQMQGAMLQPVVLL